MSHCSQTEVENTSGSVVAADLDRCYCLRHDLSSEAYSVATGYGRVHCTG